MPSVTRKSRFSYNVRAIRALLCAASHSCILTFRLTQIFRLQPRDSPHSATMKSLVLASLLLTFTSSIASDHTGHGNLHARPDHRWKFLEDDFEPAKIDQLRTEAFFAPSEDDSRGRDLSLGIGCEDLCKQCIEVITYFHRITSDPALTEPSNEFAIKKQLFVLNDRYKETPFYFKLESITSIIFNPTWALNGAEYWDDIGSEVRQGPLTTLNVYIVDVIEDTEDGTGSFLGLATPPRARSPLPTDGIMIRADHLPNGLPRSEGVLAVHEVGHWLGTY